MVHERPLQRMQVVRLPSPSTVVTDLPGNGEDQARIHPATVEKTVQAPHWP